LEIKPNLYEKIELCFLDVRYSALDTDDHISCIRRLQFDLIAQGVDFIDEVAYFDPEYRRQQTATSNTYTDNEDVGVLSPEESSSYESPSEDEEGGDAHSLGATLLRAATRILTTVGWVALQVVLYRMAHNIP
jgi:hypothetical protein